LWTWNWWTALGVLVVCLAAGVVFYLVRVTPPLEAKPPQPPTLPPSSSDIHVQVAYPRKGGVDRSTTQPGSVQAFESVDLYAGASGYLKTQTVDIGDPVKKGQVLATVDVPDLDKQVEHDQAVLSQAHARVEQMNARVTSARADLEAANAAVKQAMATHKSKMALRRFHDLKLNRYQNLWADKSIEGRLVEEETKERDAAIEAENAAEAAITTANAQVTATQAKIVAAEADVREAAAEVGVAQANLDKTRVLIKYATIVAPFDGVITRRNFFPSAYIDAPTSGSGHIPLLNVQRTDLFRVVVQVPDRDVPFTHKGNAATIEFPTLGGKQFPAKVSRVSDSEDPETRLMHVELDLTNPTGEIANGMYGRATIHLDRAEALTVPSSSLIGKAENGKGSVYVVRDGHAHLTSVLIGSDNGIEASILGGLKPEDQVITDASAGLEDGAAVTPNHG
jgi:RND family efflux transporter MFP subunit